MRCSGFRCGPVVVLAALVLLTVGHVRPLAACTPPEQPGWYRSTATIALPSMPTGVRITEMRSDLDPARVRGLEIINTTTTPLFILTTPHRGAPPEGALVTADGRGPTDQIVHNQAFVWYPLPGTEPATGTWQLVGRVGDIQIDDDAIHTTGGTIARLVHVVRDHRPADALPPPPQQVEIVMIYGVEAIRIPVTISYVLNPTYDSEAGVHGVATCAAIQARLAAPPSTSEPRSGGQDAGGTSAVPRGPGIVVLLVGSAVMVLVAGLLLQRRRAG